MYQSVGGHLWMTYRDSTKDVSHPDMSGTAPRSGDNEIQIHKSSPFSKGVERGGGSEQKDMM